MFLLIQARRNQVKDQMTSLRLSRYAAGKQSWITLDEVLNPNDAKKNFVTTFNDEERESLHKSKMNVLSECLCRLAVEDGKRSINTI